MTRPRLRQITAWSFGFVLCFGAGFASLYLLLFEVCGSYTYEVESGSAKGAVCDVISYDLFYFVVFGIPISAVILHGLVLWIRGPRMTHGGLVSSVFLPSAIVLSIPFVISVIPG